MPYFLTRFVQWSFISLSVQSELHNQVSDIFVFGHKIFGLVFRHVRGLLLPSLIGNDIDYYLERTDPGQTDKVSFQFMEEFSLYPLFLSIIMDIEIYNPGAVRGLNFLLCAGDKVCKPRTRSIKS